MHAPRRVVSDGQSLRAGFAAIRTEHEVPETFEPAALAEAEGAAQRWSADGRADLTDVPFVTLDPAGSRDLDQALHLAREGAGYRVRYAIADVAAFVTPGGALDRAVRDRALTIYCPDERVGLHPAVLSEGAASLLPGQDRPAVVWDLLLDADGEPRSTSVRRAVVRSRAQLDYVGQQAALDGGTAAPEIALLAERVASRPGRRKSRQG